MASFWDNRAKHRDLRQGLDKNEFVPFFQPIVSAQNRTVVALEVLARWMRDKKLYRSPDVFLPLAERIGLLGELDDRVSSAALIHQAEWETAMGHAIPLSLNVSVGRLNDPQLVQQIAALGHGASNISLELLETNYLDAPSEDVRERVREVRDLGTAIEIDDFGTGQTSILALTTLRPNRLKLDRQLVFPAAYSKANRDVLGSIISIAQNLDISVTAEGIEDQLTADLMTNMGCERLQGFYFCKPLPASDVIPKLQNWQSRPE